MKQKICLLVALMFSAIGTLMAQEVTFKKDLVLVDNNEYCKMREETVLLTRKNITILNLVDDEILFIKLNVNKLSENVSDNDYYNYYTLSNLATGEEMELELDLTFKKNIVKHLFQNKVITEEGTISEEGFQKFKLKYSCKCSETLANKLNSRNRANAGAGVVGGGVLTKRNRSAMLFVFGKEIKQDNVVIGSYTRSQQSVPGGLEIRYTIYDAQQNLVAEAISKGFTEKSVQVITSKDNRNHTVSISFNNDLEIIKSVAKSLIDKMYL